MAETNLVYGKGEHPVHGTWLSVDVVAFTEDKPQAKVVLIEREGEPHRGATTLPGGLLAAWDTETVAQAAARVVAEKVGVPLAGTPVVVDVVSDPNRDERGHTVSIVVAVRVPADTPGAVRVSDIPEDMPFGHARMIARAVTMIGERLFTDRELTYALLGDTTTVPYAHALCAALEPVHDSTVRSRLERSGLYNRVDDGNRDPNRRPRVEWVRNR